MRFVLSTARIILPLASCAMSSESTPLKKTVELKVTISDQLKQNEEARYVTSDFQCFLRKI